MKLARRLGLPFLVAWGAASALGAQAPRRPAPALLAKAVQRAELSSRPRTVALTAAPAGVRAANRSQLEALGIAESRVLVDRASGRPTTLLLDRPVIPGRGSPQSPSDRGLAQAPDTPSRETLGELAWSSVRDEVERLGDLLGVDTSELDTPRIGVFDDGALIQITTTRRVGGVAVRGATLHAVVAHGNLVLLGTTRWSPVTERARPALGRRAALRAVARHLDPLVIDRVLDVGRLELLPFDPPDPPVGAVAGGAHRLVWTLRLKVAGDAGVWRASVDAHSGEVLALTDVQLYETARSVTGGVLPVSNDGVEPSGIEQTGTPMPFADVATVLGPRYADAGGNLPVCVDGEIGTALDGRYVSMLDVCGDIAETSDGDLDLGLSADTNCSVPDGASLGDTRATRSVYHHLNRMREVGLGQLPDNPWLQVQVPALTNFPSDLLLGCNAFWDGSGFTFTRDTDQLCASTGELAGVVQHEWGHGLDDNDQNGEVSNPAEGIADVITALRQDDSCIGRGFFLGAPCDPGDGDPCTSCDGVRDVDWAARSSGQPHDIPFIGSCPPPLGVEGGPCGRAIHCEGAVVSESVWDLLHRDLPVAASPPDPAAAREIVSRLVYLGSGAVGDWYACTPEDPFEGIPASGDGCNVDGGYLNLLAVDDDNGDLADGTPHMEAIHDAFARHGIACALPTPVTSGCSAAPTTAPALAAQAADRAVSLSWAAVPGAASYSVLRSEGELGCDGGRIVVGSTTDTSFLDEELLNGRAVHYVVVPVGDAPSCFGPASACVTATPAPGANLTSDPVSLDVALAGGDLDGSLDNCESATLSFDVTNLGTVPLTGVAILDVEVVGPGPGTVVTSSLPRPVAAELVPCASATASFDVVAGGLAPADALVLEILVGADQLAHPRTARLRIETTETDLVPVASQTFDFETGLDGWELVQGTFGQQGAGGGDGTTHHLASSSQADDQCDQIRSPLLRLTPSSTLELWTSLDVEPSFEDDLLPGIVFWFDRADVGVVDETAGTRTLLAPDGGRLYNAEGPYGSCVTEGQEGWADAQTAWQPSTFSAAAVDGGRWTGRPVRLDVAYGTDADLAGDGFRFDQVTLIDFELVAPDAQSDVCAANTAPDAVDDELTLDVLGSLGITALDNDDDADGDGLRIESTTAPTLGSAQVVAIGPGLDQILYDRADCATGIDAFDYTIADGRGGFDTATVTVDSTALASRSAPHLALSAHAVTGPESFEGCLTLSAGDSFVVEDGGSASLWSGGSVVLDNGFSVAAGGALVVTVGSPP